MMTIKSSSASPSSSHTRVWNVDDVPLLKSALLRWAAGHSVACYFDHHPSSAYRHPFADCLAAAGAAETLLPSSGRNSFDALQDFFDRRPGLLFGYLGYDLKNELERLSSHRPDGIGFPDIHFFRPKHLARLRGNQLTIETTEGDPEAVYRAILAAAHSSDPSSHTNQLNIKARASREEYLQDVRAIQEEIREGNVYELNYCQEFYAERAVIDPLAVFTRLNELARAPFTCFYRLEDKYLLCASPERFLQKEGSRVLSQPIKGTIRRGVTEEEDNRLRQQLLNDPKERAENAMIVDLVRNDLARFARPGTVKVDELFGIYSFPLVNQMISSVSAEAPPALPFTNILRDAFPMGSMTGAPKIAAMRLIERFEKAKRGLFSGAAGYVLPNGDFDFNVVIRSILYNAATGYLSFQAGSAITIDAVPEKEYEECLLKAAGLRRALEG